MKIGILGGTDGLGKTIAKFFKSNDFDITVTGRNIEKGEKVSKELSVNFSNDNKKTVTHSDIVIIAVPIDNIENLVIEIAKSLKSDTIVIDVASVKEKIIKIMNKYLPENIEYIPSHPVFGPRTHSLEGQIIVLTPEKKGKNYKKVKEFLENQGSNIVESTAKEHDKMMAIVQVLTHFSYISTASAIAKLGVEIKDTRKFASPIYNLMVDIISRITSQNPILTYSIQKDNELGEKVRETFFESVKSLKEAITNSDEDKFIEIAKIATANIDDIESSLGRSDKAINALTNEMIRLKNSVGRVIAIENILTEKHYYGILKKLDNEFLTIKTDKNKEITMKIANIQLLDY
ncbi:MAG: prephenate dehydrogenase [Methanobrevibacter sp.]|jgi:prephenate dehydrogenase|nr:prephenate dehydrogenase [Candidatus Methanoflexus mossambicus]